MVGLESNVMISMITQRTKDLRSAGNKGASQGVLCLHEGYDRYIRTPGVAACNTNGNLQ